MPKAHLTTESLVITKPRITEKASMLSGAKLPVFTFEVPPTATKIAIKRAIKEKYNVDAVKVAIINLPKKHVVIRGKWGVKPGVKKAMVYLAPGTQIDFI